MLVDSSKCKVWLSMRQVHPDPLQDTLDALLAEADLPSLDPPGMSPVSSSHAAGDSRNMVSRRCVDTCLLNPASNNSLQQ